MPSWSSAAGDAHGAVNHHAAEGAKAALDIFLYGNIIQFMPRCTTAADIFNAIAELRLREIMDLQRTGKEPAVGENAVSILIYRLNARSCSLWTIGRKRTSATGRISWA